MIPASDALVSVRTLTRAIRVASAIGTSSVISAVVISASPHFSPNDRLAITPTARRGRLTAGERTNCSELIKAKGSDGDARRATRTARETAQTSRSSAYCFQPRL